MAVKNDILDKEAITMVAASFSVHKFFTAFFRLPLAAFCKIKKMIEVCLYLIGVNVCENK